MAITRITTLALYNPPPEPTMKDFFAFRLMITAGLVKVIYPLGVLVILALVGISWFGGIRPKGSDGPWMPLMGWDHSLLFLLFANIGWRIFCEQMILLFSIHESLNRKSDGKS